MHKTNPSEPGAGQAPINQEKLASIERKLRFHREQYAKIMLELWLDSDQETRSALERIYADATGDSLAEIHRQRMEEALIKKYEPTAIRPPA